MAAKRKKNKKKEKTKAAAGVDTTQPRRSRLSAEERLRVENMHEILGEVWEPFKTAEGAIRGLETDAAPWLELEFWDSLAEAFLRYFGKAITLQVDTAGLARARAAIEVAKSQSKVAAAPESTANHAQDERDEGGNGNSSGPQRRSGGETDSDEAGDMPEGQGEALEGLDPSTKMEMLPMGAVDHLGRGDRLGIIKKTVPVERRMLVLQRLFHLAQAPAEEVELLVTSVKELKNNSSSAEIGDVNLLETWQGVREERATAWEQATEKVRLVAASVTAVGAADSSSTTAPEVATATANCDVDVDVDVDVQEPADTTDDVIGSALPSDGPTAAVTTETGPNSTAVVAEEFDGP